MATEALYNAARHAGAARVSLRLVAEGPFWLLEIADDGQGLPVEPPTPTRRGLGLEAMRIRAEEIGASIRWESPEDGGTRVVIRFRP
jgi:signal transduction histidine kinase